MKILKLIWKNLQEGSRDLVTLGLSLVIGPFFILLYWLMIPSGSTTFLVMVQNLDLGHSGGEVVSWLEELTYPSGDPMLEVSLVSSSEQAGQLLQDRDAEVLLVIPEDFSSRLAAAAAREGIGPADITIVGDLTNPYYTVAAVLAGSVVDEFVQTQTGEERSIRFDEIALGGSAVRSEFDLYIPGILIISVVMLVFLVSMGIAQEIESGTILRLRMSPLKASELLLGFSIPTILLGVLSMLLTLGAALLLGFNSQGSILAALLIGAVTAVAVVGVGLIVAAFSKSVSQAFIIANFPLMFFMFFSGGVYPIPRVPLATIGGTVVSIYDMLPPTHAVAALNKILTLGAEVQDLKYELGALILLSLIYYGVGIWIFRRRHLEVA